MDAHPTHKCFTDAFEYIMDNIEGIDRHRYELCHGICRLSSGKKYSHAWVYDKNKDKVLSSFLVEGETTIIVFTPIDFYRELRVVNWSRYSLWQIQYLNIRLKTYGPFEDMYRRLTSDYEGYPRKKAKRINNRKLKFTLRMLEE